MIINFGPERGSYDERWWQGLGEHWCDSREISTTVSYAHGLSRAAGWSRFCGGWTTQVYAILDIKAIDGYGKTAVSYSGPTYIAIRSGKHSSSTARSHAKDFETIIQKAEFLKWTRVKTDGVITDSSQVKLVYVKLSDGGPDENPRFPKTVAAAIRAFKKYNLDLYYHCTNAPRRSAFNVVERRMAPFQELCRVLSCLMNHLEPICAMERPSMSNWRSETSSKPNKFLRKYSASKLLILSGWLLEPFHQRIRLFLKKRSTIPS